MEPLLIRQSRWSIGKQLLISICCLAASYFIITEKKTLLTSGNVAAIVFGVSGVSLMVNGVRSISRQPMILLDKAGINDTRLNVGTIPWAEILQVYIVSSTKSNAVQLAVYHPEQYRSKSSPFVIVTDDIDTSSEALANTIYQWQMYNWSAMGKLTPAPTPPLYTDRYPSIFFR